MSKISLIVLVVMALIVSSATSHDKDHPPVDPKEMQWFKEAGSSRIKKCCDDTDSVMEASSHPSKGTFRKWQQKADGYWVYIVPPSGLYAREDWYQVPQDALVRTQNSPEAAEPKYAIVWFEWISNATGPAQPLRIQILCFHPGSMS